MLAGRNRLSADKRADASQKIAERVMAIVAAEKPVTLAAYLPIRSECDVRPIIERARGLGIAIVLPAVVDPTTLVFRRFAPGAPLAASGFGTLAPEPDQPVLDPALVILPRSRVRSLRVRELGHGKGHYDRALARLAVRGVRPKLIGVAFAAQEVAAIPSEPHDVRLDWIVTENETLAIGHEQARR